MNFWSPRSALNIRNCHKINSKQSKGGFHAGNSWCTCITDSRQRASPPPQGRSTTSGSDEMGLQLNFSFCPFYSFSKVSVKYNVFHEVLYQIYIDQWKRCRPEILWSNSKGWQHTWGIFDYYTFQEESICIAIRNIKKIRFSYKMPHVQNQSDISVAIPGLKLLIQPPLLIPKTAEDLEPINTEQL